MQRALGVVEPLMRAGVLVVCVFVLLAAAASAAAAPGFRVEGNRITGPDGKVFVVKGICAAYGPFMYSDDGGWSEFNYRQTSSDLRRIRSLGANTVRIFTEARMLADAKRRTRLTATVTTARRLGFVVELVNAYSTPGASIPWISRLARTYRADPYVWIEPMNEPHGAPESGGTAAIDDWETWQREQRAYVRAIRAAGNTAPIIVNTVHWSWDLTRVDAYPLGDANVVYAAHMYGNEHRAFDAAQAEEKNASWANLAARHAVVVDEIGNDGSGGGNVNSFAWTQGAIAYLGDWIRHRGGAGVVAFVWRWSDGNTMVGAPDRPRVGTLNAWGRLFGDLLKALRTD